LLNALHEILKRSPNKKAFVGGLALDGIYVKPGLELSEIHQLLGLECWNLPQRESLNEYFTELFDCNRPTGRSPHTDATQQSDADYQSDEEDDIDINAEVRHSSSTDIGNEDDDAVNEAPVDAEDECYRSRFDGRTSEELETVISNAVAQVEGASEPSAPLRRYNLRNSTLRFAPVNGVVHVFDGVDVPPPPAKKVVQQMPIGEQLAHMYSNGKHSISWAEKHKISVDQPGEQRLLAREILTVFYVSYDGSIKMPIGSFFFFFFFFVFFFFLLGR
jgi:hypothetical protein